MKNIWMIGFFWLLLVPQFASAASWWNKDWKYRKEITFDLSPAGADVADTVDDVPVLIRLSLANFSYFNDTKPDGSDFRIIGGDDKTPLKFHFEKYDAQNQIALLWVRVPQLTGGAKTDKIYAYYGNPEAPAAFDVPGTYDTSQVLELSFSDNAGIPQDLTAYKNNPASSTAELTPAGLIGGAAGFAGKETIAVPASSSLRLIPAQGLTVSLWARIEAAQQATLFALSDQGKTLSLTIEGTTLVARGAFGAAPAAIRGGNLSLAQWHHLALTAAAGKLTLYVDGLPVSSAPTALTEIGGVLRIGSGDANGFLNGTLDEFETAKTVRSAAWIKASARAQGMNSNLVVYGADGQQEGGSQTSYFVTIAKNLTIDGWVVIGICMAMLVIALIIMIWKAVVLSRVERANESFLREFRRLEQDAAALQKEVLDEEPSDPLNEGVGLTALAGNHQEFGTSTLYRLYHSGVLELNKRIGGGASSVQRSHILSHQSISAIRASMDATLTRLQQRLSSQMVLLTIAISGGPFLGLLGTVIGVMITFAAIALSGDVNVNAIAPGTAAALAATVAGLSVAIPALFGYNWLNSRIKSIAADNRVFVDEFVTRIAEEHS